MKKKIVLWGSNAAEEKLLLALELLDQENKVVLYSFPENIATELFYNQLMNIWREGGELTFPDGHTSLERDLSVTESILPDDIKVDRTDIINRVKTEWHFVVLSAKLYQMYHSELEDLMEKVDQLKEYDDKVWEEMKTFSNKVHEQTIEKNIFREHASILKEKTNDVFTKLKDLKKIVEQRFRVQSRERADVFRNKLSEVEAKIEKGLGLKPIFEELKSIQVQFRNEEFSRRDQRNIWDKIDALFKIVKEKRFGDKKQQGNSSLERIQRRNQGLSSAIGKMEQSIRRDKNEQEFQVKRINETDGQLEAQIRQAKIKMIEQRIQSKEEKLQDMYKTRDELKAKLEKEMQRDEERKRRAEVEKTKKGIKEKIATDIAETSAQLDDKSEDFAKAATEINESKATPKKKKESIVEALSETLGESLEDVVDTVKAVADVVGDKIDEAIQELTSEEE